MSLITINPRYQPPLDPGFIPASLWAETHQQKARGTPGSHAIKLVLARSDGSAAFHHETLIFPHEGAYREINLKHVERMLKFLLWQKGGNRVYISGCDELASQLAAIYNPTGARAFDAAFMGDRIFLAPMEIKACAEEALPPERSSTVELGRHMNGCRIGFDLGGSDRKTAAVVDGKVVFSEEITWDPYFQNDPEYHFQGIQDSLERAAAHLPRVDAIGGSAAGVYVNNEPRVASLFRGIDDTTFAEKIRPIFTRLRARWNNVPFEVVNDGEVTALAGAMAIRHNAVLGVSLGTSQAGGYVDAAGHITSWLNELAFCPVDYRDDAPVDEWSGDVGCGVQYFSQQAVGRLIPSAGIVLPEGMNLPEKLVAVQELMQKDDPRARSIYETLGIYFGYAIAHYARFYDFRHVLILGRVTSGPGGELLIFRAGEVLREEFPELADWVSLQMPDEKDKRHGQAIAAASLPRIS